MSRAALRARTLSKAYFAARGEETPQAQAAELIRRITLRTDDHRWRSDDLVESATAILQSAAFDVDDFAENFLDVTLTIESLQHRDLDAGASVFGEAYPTERLIVICERAERYLPLYRTTVAHELGHIVLHGTEGLARVMSYSPNSPRRPKEEREVDEFMQSILLPDEVLKLALGLMSQNWGISLQETAGCANSAKGRWQWRHRLFRPLIEQLCLSREMLSVQLRRLGIFSEETLQYHKKYALPNKWRHAEAASPMWAIMSGIRERYGI